MRKLTSDNLEELRIGSAILGSGGGGDPTNCAIMARYEIEKRGSVSLIDFSDLDPDDLIAPIGFIGAPMADIEKIPSGREFIILFDILEKHLEKKVDVVMPFEIGGGNAFTPLMVGAQLGLPVLDADMMGRAFPEAQMSSCHLAGISPNPVFMADAVGNTTIIHAINSYACERIGRHVAIAAGSISAMIMYILSGAQSSKCTLHKSISKAMAIGKVHQEATKRGKDPLEPILKLCKGVCLGSGKITDIDRAISKGFLHGTVVIQNNTDKIELEYQNEYLIAKYNSEIVATTPDILMLLEKDTGTPVTSELLQYGLKVNLIALPAPEIWTTAEGLELVGPRYFGYEFDYHSANKKR
jgi:uncharacterized protein